MKVIGIQLNRERLEVERKKERKKDKWQEKYEDR